MIKRLYIIIYVILAVMMFSSCSKNKTNKDFTLNINVEKLPIDSVTVFTYEPQYQKMRVLVTGKLKDGQVSLNGQLDEPHVAMLKFREKDQPLYFIIEPCETDIEISNSNVIIWGGILNHEYFAECAIAEKLSIEKNAIRKRYYKQVQDSTLTAEQESKLLHQDSVVCDSIQNMTLHLSERKDVVGWLYKDQHFNRLDTLHMRQVRK